MIVGPLLQKDEQIEFNVWAPFHESVKVHIYSPENVVLNMSQDCQGYWKVQTRLFNMPVQYKYVLNDTIERPDPASRYQPHGVHGVSEVVNHRDFQWNDSNWTGIERSEMVIYELHVGCFTTPGTFNAMIEKLPYLKDTGINMIEIMPVSQFPGAKNWGYDGVYPYAVQNSYGGVEEFKNFVDACHTLGLGVILDVVYNHFGPEGNYLRDFGPYFTSNYKTPWGEAINFDGAYSNHVRSYFIENALYWFKAFHVDALRLDAIHAIYDFSAQPFLRELSQAVELYNEKNDYKRYLIAESDLNDSRVITPVDKCGFGIDAQWADDVHHALHVAVTEEQLGYYKDFSGISDLKTALERPFIYNGKYSAVRKRDHGNEVNNFLPSQFVVFSQNHDQIGNRLWGDRLSTLVSFEQLKLNASFILLSPYIPLLFMGEEYGETNPFLYFVDHGDEMLIQAVRDGRKKEFAEFHTTDDVPDPFTDDTYYTSKLDWEKIANEKNSKLLAFYKKLISFRKHHQLGGFQRKDIVVHQYHSRALLILEYKHIQKNVFCIFNFSQTSVTLSDIDLDIGEIVIDSAAEEFSVKASGNEFPALLEVDKKISALSCRVYKTV